MALVVRPAGMMRLKMSPSSTVLNMGTRQRAWAKGDLSDKDIFEAEDAGEVDPAREKNKLSPEITFFDGDRKSVV